MIEKWIESNEPLTLEKFDIFKTLTRGINPELQMLFLKKVFSEIDKKILKYLFKIYLESKHTVLKLMLNLGNQRKSITL